MATQTIDREKVLAVIAAEHKLIGGELVEHTGDFGGPPVICESPGHCALGALLYAAGMPDKTILDLGEPSEWGFDESEEGGAATVALWDHYRLRRWHAQEIMVSNDDHRLDGIPERRAQVMARIATMCDVQRDDAPLDDKMCERFDENLREVLYERAGYDDDEY